MPPVRNSFVIGQHHPELVRRFGMSAEPVQRCSMHAASDDNVCPVRRGWRGCQITIDQLEGGSRLPSVYGVYPQRPYGTQLVVDVAQLFRDVQGGRPCGYAMLRPIGGSHLWPSKRWVQLHPAPLVEVGPHVEVAERLGYGDQTFVE